MRKGLLIELVDDVVTSESAATAATPEALPYIPGAMLLGAAVKKAVSAGLDMSGSEAFDLFNSGSLCFCDGLPIAGDGRLAFPVPISVHRRKVGQTEPGDKSSTLLDFAEHDRQSDFEQLRDCAVHTDASEHTVKRIASLRTAISIETGRADEGQLFGYEALRRGQFFWAGIEGDPALVEKALNWLVGAHLLGRSRSAEFGRVQITACETWDFRLQKKELGSSRYVWLLSDFCALDRLGFPTYRPEPPALNTYGSVNWQRSFTRNRRVAGFNGHWGKRTPEKALIERGSVLMLEGCDLEPGLHRFGIGRELGLGHALVSDVAPLAMLRELSQPVIKLQERKAPPSVAETSELAEWLKARACGLDQRAQATGQVDKVVATLWQHYQSARHLAGQRAGPGLSQWGRVSAGLLRGEVIANLTNTKPWDARFDQGDGATFRGFVATVDPTQLALLAKKMRVRLEKEGWSNED